MGLVSKWQQSGNNTNHTSKTLGKQAESSTPSSGTKPTGSFICKQPESTSSGEAAEISGKIHTPAARRLTGAVASLASEASEYGKQPSATLSYPASSKGVE